jgi:signal transduction histidine kinase
MWPTGYIPPLRLPGGSETKAFGPAMTTLRSVIAYLAMRIRCAGAIYIVLQVIVWHSFYTAQAWRLAVPVLAAVWAVLATLYLRRRRPSAFLACVDSAVYVAIALLAQGAVPPAVRDDAFSWLVIAMSGQIAVPAWYAPGLLSAALALIVPLSYWAGALLRPVTDMRTLTQAAILLIVFGLAHRFGRRLLYGYATASDADLSEADQAASQQYAVLSRNIERREHERLLHDTVLNTLSALARAGRDDVAGVVNRCRQDVALIEAALGDADLLADGASRPVGDLLGQVRAIAGDMRARGLDVHVEADDGGGLAVAVPVATAFANAVREALSNVAAHARTTEAWVLVGLSAPEGSGAAHLVRVSVRDQGAGFDVAGADPSRLGLRRSIVERAADCGGQASVWSRPGQGTVVSLSWPASEAADEPDPVGLTPAERTSAGSAGRENPPW